MDGTMFGDRRPGKRDWEAEGKHIVFDIYQRNGKVIVFPFMVERKILLNVNR